MTIKPKNIDHICLWVRSLTQAKAYYEKVFGFICTPRQGSTDTLIVESDHIHFFIQETGDDARFIDKQHLSFEVDSLHDVITSLNKMGISDYETGQVDFFSRRNYKCANGATRTGFDLSVLKVSTNNYEILPLTLPTNEKPFFTRTKNQVWASVFCIN